MTSVLLVDDQELVRTGLRITRRLIEDFTRAGRTGPPPGYDQVTEREKEILVLIARGRSKADIATELCEHPDSEDPRGRGVLIKLGVRDRVQVVVAAYESGLVRPGE